MSIEFQRRRQNADDPDFSEAFELLSYQLGKRMVPEPIRKAATAPKESYLNKENNLNRSENKPRNRSYLLDQFVKPQPDNDFNIYIPGESDLIRVCRRQVEKYFIR